LYSILAFPLFALFGEGLGMLLRLQDNRLYTTFLIGGWCAWLVGLGTAQALKRKVKQRQGPYAPPQHAMRLPPRPLGRGGWRTLCVALAVGVLILICTDGYIFALVGSGALSLFMFTTYLREQHVDHRRCYLRLEWILLGYSLPFLAITALVPLQVQWYPEAGSTLPHIGLHLFFPAMGTLVSTCLLEGFCLRRITSRVLLQKDGDASRHRPNTVLNFLEEEAHMWSTKGRVSCYAHFLLLNRGLLWDGPRPEEDCNRIWERCQCLWQFSLCLRHPDCA
jgi:hypothetical protein